MKIKSSVIRDTIELEDANGNVIKEIPFTFNVAEAGRKVTAGFEEIGKLNAKGNEDELGNAVIKTMKVIFGDEAVAALLEHYEDHYIEMFSDIMPIVTEVIIPHVNEWNQKLLEQSKRTKFRR